MKKKLVISLIMTMCLTMLAGCDNTATNTDDSQTDAGNSEMNHTVPDMEDTFLADKTVWKDSQNLYEISQDALDGGSQSEVYRFGDDLLLTYTQYDKEQQKAFYYVKLIGLESGEVLHELQLNALTYGKVQILDEGIAIHDLGEGRSYLLDETLQVVEEYELTSGMFCWNRAGDRMYQFTHNEGIKAMNPSTGEEEILKGDMRGVYLYEITEEAAVFTYVDANTLLRGEGILDLTSGEMQTFDSMYSYSAIEYAEELWLGKVDGADSLYVMGDNDSQTKFVTNPNAVVSLNADSGQIVVADTAENGTTSLIAYNKSGQCLSYCETTDLVNVVYYDLVWYEEYNGYVFTLMDTAGENHLLFWDMSADSAGENLALEEVEDPDTVPAGTAVAQEYYDRAKQLSETYDVEILIADQCDTGFVDHTAELLTSESELEAALDTLEYVLGRYPTGFFTQLKHNSYEKIEIQVLGMLKKASSTEEVTYISGGFVTTAYPGKFFMALDARGGYGGESINSILAMNMYHEISHMIDKRLAYNSLYNENAVYTDEGWEELNPDGFAYNDSYYGTLDSQYADSFVDAYACSYATEDRARIMEYAMMGDVSTFAGKAGLIEKLEYYCQGIRDGFDTTGWPEETAWEKFLNEVK